MRNITANYEIHFSPTITHTTTAYVEQRRRLAGNKGFNESIHCVENILKDAGYKKEMGGEADGLLTYRIETRTMILPTWEPVNASLFIDGAAVPVLEFSTNRNMIAAYSASTPTLIDEVTQKAVERLGVEFALSKTAISKSGKIAEEQHILDVWTSSTVFHWVVPYCLL